MSSLDSDRNPSRIPRILMWPVRPCFFGKSVFQLSQQGKSKLITACTWWVKIVSFLAFKKWNQKREFWYFWTEHGLLVAKHYLCSSNIFILLLLRYYYYFRKISKTRRKWNSNTFWHHPPFSSIGNSLLYMQEIDEGEFLFSSRYTNRVHSIYTVFITYITFDEHIGPFKNIETKYYFDADFD